MDSAFINLIYPNIKLISKEISKITIKTNLYTSISILSIHHAILYSTTINHMEYMADVETLLVEILKNINKPKQYCISNLLISKYIEFASKYIDINIINKNGRTSVENSTNLQNNIVINTLSFEKRLNAYFGRNDGIITEDILATLNSILIKQGIPSREIIQKQPLLTDGTKMYATVDVLINAIKSMNKSYRTRLYSSIESILVKLWGYPSNDKYIYLKESILEDYVKTQPIINEILTATTRSSNPNVSFRLMWHLYYFKIPINEALLKLPKNSTSDVINKTILNAASEKLGRGIFFTI